MTDYLDSKPVTLTGAQFNEIIGDGVAAMASINGAGGSAPPVGVWKKMYYDIDTILAGSGLLSASILDQEYWYSQAGFVNSDNENVPSGYFVRDVTAIGMNVSGPTDVNVQKASDAIGEQIYNEIESNFTLNGIRAIPAFWRQLNADIYSAFQGHDAAQIYTYPKLPMGAWGGTFYYWNSPYSPTETPTDSTPPPTPLSQSILGDSTANQTFITDYSQAIANTVIHFQTSGIDPSQIVPSVMSALNGTLKIWNSGWGGKLDIVELLANTISDYQASGGGSTTPLQNALVNFVQSQVGLYLGNGSTNIVAGGGADILVGGQGIGSAGNDTLTGGGGSDTFLVNLPTTGSVTQTINDALGLGQIVVSSNGQFNILGGSAADPLTVVAGQLNTWQDVGGTQYVYGPSNDQLVISGGYLGSGNEVVVDNFNLGLATGTNPISGTAAGDVGIFLPQAINLTAGATALAAGTSPPNFIAGGEQSYTVSVDAPSTTAQTMTVTLTGAPPSDFGVDVGSGIGALNSDGTFIVTIPAGETNAAFTLVNSGDVGANATLQLVASLNGSNTPVSSAPLTFNFVETSPDPFLNPTIQTTNVITGSSVSGGSSLWPSSATSTWEYVDDGQNDSIQTSDQTASGGIAEKYVDATTGGSDVIVMTGQQNSEVFTGNASYSITDNSTTQNYVEGVNNSGANIVTLNNSNQKDVVWLGNGSNKIYGNTQTDIDTAIALANTGSASGLQGDLLTANHGNNTIVGSSGNDLILVGDGNNLFVAGPGNEDFVGGVTTAVQPASSWQVTSGLVTNGVEFVGDPYTVPSGVTYEGSTDNVVALGVGNDTIFGGKGSDFIELSNGANDVELGSGNSSVFGGMGNSTIIGGGGNDLVFGGGGGEYIDGDRAATP
jgi:hypothetical protein